MSGDTITLAKEECNAGSTPRFYDNRYRFEQSGDQLRFTTVSNACPDKVMETILTAHPWKKVH